MKIWIQWEKTVFWAHCKYVQWNYREDTCKNCKTGLQWFTVPCTSILVHITMQKCRWYNNPLYFKFTVISLHLKQQSSKKYIGITVNLITVHKGAFCQFPFRWIYYCHSNKSTGKEPGKMHLCVLDLEKLRTKKWRLFV